MEYGKLIIIPDENKIIGGVFERKVASNHLNEIQNFSDYYRLGYKFENNEYQDAPCFLALDGHLVIKTIGNSDNFICYIPEFVTDDQSMWFYQNQEVIKKYFMCGAFGLKKKDEGYEIDVIEGFDNIIDLINKRNFLYQSKLKEKKNLK